MTILSRDSVGVLASLTLMAIAAVFTLLSALVIVPLTLLFLLIVVMTLSGSIDLWRLESGWTVVWATGALFLAYHNAVTALEAINNPSAKRIGLLLGLSALALLTCPLSWSRDLL